MSSEKLKSAAILMKIQAAQWESTLKSRKFPASPGLLFRKTDGVWPSLRILKSAHEIVLALRENVWHNKDSQSPFHIFWKTEYGVVSKWS